MRKNARWSNGDPLTAQDFVFSYQRELTPEVAAPFADFLFILKGADAFFKGKTRDFSTAYDELINQAAATADPVQRLGLLRQAETILLEAAPIIPIYWYTRTYLLDPSVQNWYPVLLDSHPPKFLDLEAPQTGMMR